MPSLELFNPEYAQIKYSNILIINAFNEIVNQHVKQYKLNRSEAKIDLLLQLTKSILSNLPNNVNPSAINLHLQQNIESTSISFNFIPKDGNSGAFVTVTLFLSGTAHVTFSNGAFDWQIKTNNPINLQPFVNHGSGDSEFHNFNLIPLKSLLANIPSFLAGNYVLDMLAKTPKQIAMDNELQYINTKYNTGGNNG